MSAVPNAGGQAGQRTRFDDIFDESAAGESSEVATPGSAPPDVSSLPPADSEHPAFQTTPLEAYADYEAGNRHAMDSIADEPVWPDAPKDVFGRQDLPKIDPFVIAPQLFDFCYDQHERTGADLVQFIAQTISACASAIPEGIKVQVKKNDPEWTQRACIWIAIVGDPGVNKSGPQLIAYSHLWAHELRMREAQAEAMTRHERKMKEYARDEANYLKDKSPLVDWPEPPEKPPVERLLAEDMTIEGMRDVLAANPRGKITILAGELAGWLASFDIYSANGASGRDRAAYLQANDGGARPVDRAGKSLIVPNWSAQVVGGIQPDILQGFIKKTQGVGSGDGLMQRFHFIMAQANVNDIDRAPNVVALNKYRQILDNLVAMQPGSAPVMFSDAAHVYREELKDWAADARTVGSIPAGMVGWLNKAHAQYARFCLIYACIEAAAEGSRYAPTHISADVAKRVLALFQRLLYPHAVKMYLGILSQTSPVHHAVQAVAAKLLIMENDTVKLRDVYRSMPDYAWDLLSEPQRKEVCVRLENAGWWVPAGGTDGLAKLPKAFRLHPRRVEAFPRERADELARRADAVDRIAKSKAARQAGED